MTPQKNQARRWKARMDRADSPADVLAGAFDRFRSASARMYRPQRDLEARTRSGELADAVMLRVAGALVSAAEELERADGRA